MALIRTAQEFIDQTTTAGVTNTLVRDLVLPNTFTPFTTYAATFEGRGYNIAVDIQAPDTDNIAIFGEVTGSVTQLSVSGIISGLSGVGAIASSVSSTATITQCRNRALIIGIGLAGGIIGVGGASDIENSYNEGTIIGLERIGGFIGQNTDTGTVDNSHSVGVVKRIDDVANLGLTVEEVSAYINALYEWSEYGTGNLDGWTIDLTGNSVPDSTAMEQVVTLNDNGWTITTDA